jgi:hypothetical protein
MNTKQTTPSAIGFLLALVIPALALSLTACNKPAGSEAPAAPPVPKEQKSPDAKPAVTTESKASALATSNPPSRALVFRNVRSWRRKVDFEEVLTDLGYKFDVRSSTEMAGTDLTPYGFVIIPGAQWQNDYYRHYAENAARFDRYVTNGGTLVLELNGAERDGIPLPRGVSMVSHGAVDNVITLPDHPILTPLAGRPIHANYASHGYLEGVPKDAIVLVTEMEEPKPTFIEYACGRGRVIAACQCFHDQDGSGRGPLMPTVISYAAEREWFSPKK